MQYLFDSSLQLQSWCWTRSWRRLTCSQAHEKPPLALDTDYDRVKQTGNLSVWLDEQDAPSLCRARIAGLTD